MLSRAPTRTVADTRLALRGMTGADPRDPLTCRELPQPLPPTVPFGSAWSATMAWPRPRPRHAALDQAAGCLTDAGYVVEEVELPLLTEAYRLWYLLCMEEFRQIMPLVEEVGDEGMKQSAEDYYAVSAEWWGSPADLADYMNGYARAARDPHARRVHGAVLDDLLPVSAEQAFEQAADIASVESMRRVWRPRRR